MTIKAGLPCLMPISWVGVREGIQRKENAKMALATRSQQEIYTTIKDCTDLRQVVGRIEQKDKYENWMLALQSALGISWSYYSGRLTVEIDRKIKEASMANIAELVYQLQGLTMHECKEALNKMKEVTKW